MQNLGKTIGGTNEHYDRQLTFELDHAGKTKVGVWFRFKLPDDDLEPISELISKVISEPIKSKPMKTKSRP